MRALALLALLLVAAPAAAQSVSAPTGETLATMYLHQMGFQDFPANTQEPEDGPWGEDTAVGVATWTLSCLPDVPSVGINQDYHTWYGYSTPTYVEYNFTENGRPRVNIAPVLSWDIPISASSAPVVHWYLVQSGPLPGTDAAPVVIPGVVVQATIRQGPIDLGRPYEDGPVLLEGRTEPAVLAGPASQGVEYANVDGRHVYGFTAALDSVQPLIPAQGAYWLEVRAFLDNPACAGDGQVTPAVVEPFSSPAHRSRIEWVVEDVLRIESLRPEVFREQVRINATFNSAWGSYDVNEQDPDGIRLTIEGPDGPVEAELTAFTQQTHAWYHFTEPVQATWELDRSGARAGLYWVNLTVLNDQRTATAEAHAAFRLGPDAAYAAPAGGGLPDIARPEQAMPGSSLVAPAAVALAAVLCRSRLATIKRHDGP